MNFFDKYFVFSSSEKRGIYLFLILIFLMCVVYWLMPKFLQPPPTDFSELRAKLEANKISNEIVESKKSLFYFNPNTISKDSLEILGFTTKQAWNTVNFRKKVKQFETKEEMKKLYAMTDSLYQAIEPYIVLDDKMIIAENQPKTKNEVQESLFNFNPNTISKDSLELLGFSSKTATIFMKYRASKKGFKTKEEIKSVYGITPKMYQEIEPYIILPKEKLIKTEEKLEIELNAATKEQLIEAKGIGTTFSKRILEYRNKLGGFVSVNQLKEVYGIDEDWIKKYGGQFTIDKRKVKKLNINTIEFKKLLKHPYIEFSEVKRIINYRDMHGKFSSLEQIRDNNLINPEQYRKIVSYLSLD